MVTQSEIIALMDQFINENGMWTEFRSWIMQQGYKLSELGYDDEDEDTGDSK